MSRGRWVAAVVLATGCVTPAPVPAPVPPVAPAPAPAAAPTPSSLLLAHADLLFEQRDYEHAQEIYSDFLRLYPGESAAPRALAALALMDRLGKTREDLNRLNAEVLQLREQAQATEVTLDRLRRDLGTRTAELARARQELGERQSELTRLLGETEQLRADLEMLKNVDIRLERRR